MKSKVGIIFIILYAILIGALWWVESSCTGWGCDYSMIIPIMPWSFLFEGVVKISIPLYIFLLVINAAILYFIGLSISKIIKSFKRPSA